MKQKVNEPKKGDQFVSERWYMKRLPCDNVYEELGGAQYFAKGEKSEAGPALYGGGQYICRCCLKTSSEEDKGAKETFSFRTGLPRGR